MIIGTWQAARAHDPDLTEAETREALHRLDPLWDELFPAEQARIIRLRTAGLTDLVRDLGAVGTDALRAVA